MKRFQVISEELMNFDLLEDFQQSCVVDYINCPSVPDCDENSEINRDICNYCKINWLLEEWE